MPYNLPNMPNNLHMSASPQDNHEQDGWPMPTSSYIQYAMDLDIFTDCLERVQFVVGLLSDDPDWCPTVSGKHKRSRRLKLSRIRYICIFFFSALKFV